MLRGQSIVEKLCAGEGDDAAWRPLMIVTGVVTCGRVDRVSGEVETASFVNLIDGLLATAILGGLVLDALVGA
jgi:hypothetical protein